MLRIERSNEIVIPKGDTGMFTITIYGTTFDDDDEAIFAVVDKSGRTIFEKSIRFVNNTVTVRLTNAETKNMPIGKHNWDLRAVMNFEEDITDVHSLFSMDGMPIFKVTGVSTNV